MADFCMQCSLEVFNKDFGDLKDIVKTGQTIKTICEGCGYCIVDHTGRCVSKECLEKHGAKK